VIPNRTGLPSQYQERRLEDVVHVVGVVEHAPANAEDHAPMPIEQRGERGFIPAAAKALQQFAIANAFVASA
jgi:hypothetical protein